MFQHHYCTKCPNVVDFDEYFENDLPICVADGLVVVEQWRVSICKQRRVIRRCLHLISNDGLLIAKTILSLLGRLGMWPGSPFFGLAPPSDSCLIVESLRPPSCSVPIPVHCDIGFVTSAPQRVGWGLFDECQFTELT